MLEKIIEKIIMGFIKFYVVYMLFGVAASIILCVSADLRCLIDPNIRESFFLTMIHSPESLPPDAGERATIRFWLIAFDSVPGDTFLSALLGVSFDSNVIPDIAGLIGDMFKSGNVIANVAEKLYTYDLFWRDMAVATCASMVLYAVVHLKDLLKKFLCADLSVWIAWAMASVFWIFAAYTFGEVLVYALELRVDPGNWNILYIIIIITALLLEAVIHAWGGKCKAWKLIVLLSTKIFFNMQRGLFVAHICATILFIASAVSTANSGLIMKVPFNMLAIIMSSVVVIGLSIVESKLTKWSENTGNVLGAVSASAI